MNTILPLIYLQKCPSIMSQVVFTPEICWIVITETWSLVYNPLSTWYKVEKEDISGKEIYLIMTNPWCEQITYGSAIIMGVL